MTTRAPALFVGHGSPMNAIEDTPAARGWAEIATRFPKPRAIACVSAHWVTEGVRVMSNARPRTIHDFGRGFPQALFEIQYPAPGAPDLARDIVSRLSAFGAQLDESWGLDHGTWAVVKHMYPAADVPIVQISLDARRPAEDHYAIGQALAPLRDAGVLLIGSGNIVHNLQSFFRNPDKPTPWDRAFDDDITGAIERRDHAAVLSYATHPAIPQANADWEHFFPLFYTLAAQRAEETPYVFNRHYFPGISMTSIAFGLPQ
ncbi:MAG: 4,5-DOPA dioxygenase extradiol [Hyphomonadaceae bacterium]